MKQDSWNPQQYDKFKLERSQPFYDLLALIEPVNSNLATSSRAVDLGCGTGELTAELHKYLNTNLNAKMNFTETHGIDSSDAMLQKASSLAAPGVSFAKGDIQTWEQPAAFNLVFSNAAVQWCSDHAGIVARIKRSLKPGGQLAVQMPMNHDYPTHTIAHEMSQQTSWKQLLKNETYEQQQRMLSAEEYASLLFHLGFQEQKVFVRVYAHVLESREAVIEWVRGTLLTHFQSRLSPQEFINFENEFRQRLFQRLPDEKPFFYPFKRILIWAKV